MKNTLLLLSLVFLLPACRKKEKNNNTTSEPVTAEQLAGFYLWVDYSRDMSKSGTYTSMFTSCESCNKNDTFIIPLNKPSVISEAGGSCGLCSYSMLLNASSWSVKENNILMIGSVPWKVASYKDSMLELLSDPDSSNHPIKLQFRKVHPETLIPKTYTLDMLAGKYLWDQYSVDASRTGSYTDMFTSCESCNKNDTLQLIKGGTSSIREEGTSCGSCSKGMVFNAGSWTVNQNVLAVNGNNWVIMSFDNNMLQLFLDPGAPNARQKTTFIKVQ